MRANVRRPRAAHRADADLRWSCSRSGSSASFAQARLRRIGHLRYLLELAAVIGHRRGRPDARRRSPAASTSRWRRSSPSRAIMPAAAHLRLAIRPASPAMLADPGGRPRLIGLLNGLGVVLLRVHPLIMTLAMATFLQGAADPHRRRQRGLRRPTRWSPGSATAGRSACRPAIVLWLVVSAAIAVRAARTPLGAWLFAIGANPLAAGSPACGVGRDAADASTPSAGFCAGLAGLLVLGMNRQGYVGIGEPYLLASIAAVVLGGTSILGGARHLCRHHRRRRSCWSRSPR